MCVQLDGVRHSAAPPEAMLLFDWLAGECDLHRGPCCIVCRVAVASLCGLFVLSPTHLDHTASADLL